MRGAVVLVGVAGCAGEAFAAPWAQEQGEWYTRIAISSEEVEGLSAVRTDLYTEYGFGGGWSATAKAEAVSFNGNSDFDTEGYRATIRKELHRGDNLVVSVEGGVLHGAAFGGAPTGCDETGAEARIGAGWSGGYEEGRDWFAFAEVAARAYESGCRRERLELGYGTKVAGKFYTVSQLWLERGSGEARSDKFETALVYRGDFADVSIAYREELSGRFEETGVVLAVAKRF